MSERLKNRLKQGVQCRYTTLQIVTHSKKHDNFLFIYWLRQCLHYNMQIITDNKFGKMTELIHYIYNNKSMLQYFKIKTLYILKQALLRHAHAIRFNEQLPRHNDFH